MTPHQRTAFSISAIDFLSELHSAQLPTIPYATTNTA